MRWLISPVLIMIMIFTVTAGPPVFPITPQPVPKPPTPVPSNVITSVLPGQWYFIQSDIEYVWKVVPDGVVSILSKQTPFVVAGVFVDGTGASDEERVYNSKYLYQVKPVGSGSVTLIGTPKNVPIVKSDDILVQNISVGPPIVPVPTDPFTQSIQAAFTSDSSISKSSDIVSLAATFSALSDPNKWKNISTSGDLFSVIHNSTNSQIGDKLGSVRKLLGTELGKVLPANQDAKLTDQNKSDAAAQMKKFAQLLEVIK